MPEKDPTHWTIGTWVIALIMAFGGGAVNWWSKVRDGHARPFNVIELIGELTTSGFVGVGAYMLLDGLGHPASLCAAGSGIAGHMATRLLYVVEKVIERKLLGE